MRRSTGRRPSIEAPRSAAFRLFPLVVFLAVASTACRPDGPAGPTRSASVVTVSPEAVEVPVEGRVRLEATIRDSEGEVMAEAPVTWTSSDPNVASVDEMGEVTGLALGPSVVTASVEGASASASVDVRGFLIGAGGGVVRSADDRTWAAVPPGALSEDAVITLEPASASALPGGGNAEGFTPGSAYELRVDVPEFARSVELSIRYDGAAIPSGIPESSLRLRRAAEGRWVQTQGSSVDPEANEVRGEVERAGVYAAVGDLPNRAPTATIKSPEDGVSVPAGESVGLEGEGSDPEDGDLTGGALVWTSNLDGRLGTGGSVTTSELSIGEHAVRLTVTDSDEATDSDEIRITIENNRPDVTITDPEDGASFRAGHPVEFRGTGSDPEDGSLSGAALTWTSSLDDRFGTGRSVTTSELSIGDHTIRLTARDSHGASDTDRIDITIENNPPTATITSPEDGAILLRSQSITFEGSGSDPEDGELTGGALVWTSDLDGRLGTGESVTTSGLSPGRHTITLTVTDSHEDTAVDQIVITILDF